METESTTTTVKTPTPLVGTLPTPREVLEVSADEGVSWHSFPCFSSELSFASRALGQIRAILVNDDALVVQYGQPYFVRLKGLDGKYYGPLKAFIVRRPCFGRVQVVCDGRNIPQ